MLGDTINEALKKHGFLHVQYSIVLCTGLSKTGKSSFSHMLLKKRNRNPNPGDNSTLFIQKINNLSKSKTDCHWEEIDIDALKIKFDTYLKSITKLNHLPGNAEVQEIWSILMLLDISIPAFLTYHFPKTIFTCIIDRFSELKTSFDQYQQKNNVLPLQGFDNLHFFRSMISANCLKESNEEFDMFKELVAIKEEKFRYNTAFVATHLDKSLNVDTDSINIGLDDMLNDINCPDYDDPLSILHLGDCKLIHAVNISKTPDENVAELFVKMNQTKQVTYKIPITWLLLVFEVKQLCCNQDRQYIKYTEVFETIWKAKFNNFNESNLKAALNFFDYLGVFLYFDDAASESYIFPEWKWLFETLCKFLTKPITTTTSYNAYNLFMYGGLLSERLISEISQSFESTIRMDILIKLLVHLKFAAPLNCIPGIKYFIPCRLPVLKDDTQISVNHGDIQFKSLFITFLSGTLHPSFFCLFAAHFMENGWSTPSKSKETKRYTFSNLITFSADNGYSVTLYDKTFWLEIQIRNQGPKAPDLYFHGKVFIDIETGLVEVCKRLKRNINEVKYGFQCTICSNVKEHMMVVHKKPEDRFPLGQCCKRRNRKQVLKDICYTVWFVNVNVCLLYICSFAYTVCSYVYCMHNILYGLVLVNH